MIHVGYYIVGKERQEHKDVPARECGNNKNHQINATMNFCPECGEKLISVVKDDSRTLNIYDIPEEEGCIEDHFLFPEYTPGQVGEVVGVSNYRACGHFELSDTDSIIDLDSTTMTLEKERHYADFMERHAHDIELLRKYVYDDIEVKYGIFEYHY